MLDKIIFFNVTSGLPINVGTITHSGIYNDKQIYNGNIAIFLPVDNIDTDDIILSTYHWTGTEIDKHLPKTNPIFIWDKTTFSYIEPPNYLQIIKDQTINNINALTSQTIYNKYPQYTQTNMSTRYMELMTLNQTGTQEALDIQGVWDWIKSVREINHIALANITKATDISALQKIESEYKVQLSVM